MIYCLCRSGLFLKFLNNRKEQLAGFFMVVHQFEKLSGCTEPVGVLSKPGLF